MANIASLKNDLATNKKQSGAGSIGNTVKGLLDSPSYKKRFEEVLDKKAPQFMSSIVNLVNGDDFLKAVDQKSVIASAMVAATLDLPIDKNLGYAWVVPYAGKAQFQLGYKGYIQLALRTGQYKSINVVEICEGELIKWNPLTEEIDIDFDKRKSDAVIGYAGYFELINGFKKTVYWSKEQIEKHKRRFSKSGKVWNTDFDAMAKKTVLRNMLSKWGILSIEMQMAQNGDMNSINSAAIETGDIEGNIEYLETEYTVDSETGEIQEAEIVDDVAQTT